MRVGFNVVTAGSCLLQGVFCGLLLGRGVVDLGVGGGSGFPSVVAIAVPVYLVFAALWAMASCSLLPMRDGGRREESKLWVFGYLRGVFGYLRDILAGAFAGIIFAMPAVMLYFGVARVGGDGAQDLSAYLNCEKTGVEEDGGCTAVIRSPRVQSWEQCSVLKQNKARINQGIGIRSKATGICKEAT